MADHISTTPPRSTTPEEQQSSSYNQGSTTTGDGNTNLVVTKDCAKDPKRNEMIAQAVLQKIAEDLGEDWENLGTRLKIPPAKIEHLKDAKAHDYCANEMLKIWYRKTPLQKRTLESLKTALHKAGKGEIADCVDDQIKDIFDLIDVANQLGDAWRPVGTYLGVTIAEMDNIKNVPKPNSVDSAFKMLTHWQSSLKLKPGEDRKQILIEALKKANREDIVA